MPIWRADFLTLHAHLIGDRLIHRLQNFSPTSPTSPVTLNTQFQLLYRICCALFRILCEQAF
ncbi:hypothetical protein H6G81_35565 [Scytonema hofmannii FACHB-248]|uniref:Uncharacterized protein n=1 Tax=Scytonema hofmannii FACHB-248 TaxID=1842502 RepID=A0ABR8H311_9CYAN|nr:hypothetical protein [Scytonema hofmannii FACHB-248]